MNPNHRHYQFQIPTPASTPALFKSAIWEATFSDVGLCKLAVRAGPGSKKNESDSTDKRFARLKKMIAQRLSGKDVNFDFGEFDLSDAPDFHRSVWRAMFSIPFGAVLSYGDVAADAGSPMAARACGQACGANRIILFIPCHRVVASSGIGGFGCGLEWKRALLALEGVTEY